MFPFYLLFFAAIFFAWACPPKSGKWFLFFLMLAMSMFRGMNVGGDDTIAYYNNSFDHEFSLESTLSYDLEFLFVWWTNFIREHHLNPRWCLYSLSLIQFIFLYLSSKRFKVGLEKVLFFFLLLNYYYLSLEISRQLASNAILLYAYSFLIEEDKKKYWFFPLVILAASIHLTSILALPFFVCILYKPPTFKRLGNLGFVIVAVVFIFMQSYGAKFSEMLISRVDLLAFYQHLGEETEAASGSSLVGFIVQLIKIEFIYYVYIKIARSDHHLIANILFVSLVMTIVLSPIVGNINRMVILAGIVQVIAYPLLLEQTYIPRKEKQLFLISVTVFWGAVCLRDLAAGNYFLAPYYMTLPF